MNPQPTVLETVALPIELHPCARPSLDLAFLVRRVLAAETAVLRDLQLLLVGLLVLRRRVVPALALAARQADQVSRHRFLRFLAAPAARPGSPFRPRPGDGVERETGFEPATNSLEGCDSTTELLPREHRLSELVQADGFEPP